MPGNPARKGLRDCCAAEVMNEVVVGTPNPRDLEGLSSGEVVSAWSAPFCGVMRGSPAGLTFPPASVGPAVLGSAGCRRGRLKLAGRLLGFLLSQGRRRVMV